jgi:lipoprotein-releasing system permease protein
MLPRFEYFMAFRYLRGAEGRAEGRSFLRFITYVAIGGVALGVAALLLSLAIVRGFSQEITEKIMGFGSHIQVQSYFHDEPLDEAEARRSQILSTPGVTRVAPIVEDVVLLRQSKESIDGVRLLGTSDPPGYLRRHLVAGTFTLSGSEGPAPLVVGAGLADRLGLDVGELVTGFSLRNSTAENGGARLRPPRVEQFEVTGIFQTSLSDIDANVVFTSLQTSRRMVDMPPDAVSRFDVSVQNVSAVRSVAQSVKDRLGFSASVRTIYQIQPYSSLFAWVNLQQSIIPIVIGVIIIVAAFNIIGTLLMMILEKTREIGILQGLGTSQGTLKRLFLSFGLLIGGVGTLIGSAIALLLAWLQLRFEIIPLPEEAYYMTTAPISLNPIDYLIVGSLTLLLCGLAAYIPARVAARIEPVRAIRFQ